MIIDRKLVSHFDWVLFGFSLLIPLLSLVVLYSAGYDPNKLQQAFSWLPLEVHSPTFLKQVIFILIGLVMMAIGISLSPQFMHRYAYLVYSGCVLALLVVLALGSEAKGAQRWLSFGGITFQPSEVMKFGVILALARYLARHPPRTGGAYGFVQILVPFMIFGLPMVLIMRQPDLGTALAIGAVGFSMVLFMGIRFKALLIMFLAVVFSVVPAWEFVLKPYQKNRVRVLFDPDADPLGAGYHIIQSQIAVGSGALTGKGFLQGTQTQLEFLPEHTTDFIFSVLAEEWGFVGCALVLFLFFCLIYRMLKVVLRSKDLYSSLVAFGLAAQIFFNAIINIGMVIGMLPVVGLPLPLFSYGGTSLLSTMFAVGIVLGVSMRRLSFASRS